MGLGWHTPLGGGGTQSTGASDPLMVEALQLIASELGLLRIAVEKIAEGQPIPDPDPDPEPTPDIPEYPIVDELGAYVMSDSGAFVTYDTTVPPEEPSAPITTDAGLMVVSESGAFVVYEGSSSTSTQVLSEGNSLVKSEAGELVIAEEANG